MSESLFSEPQKAVSLAKVATVLAITACIAFGLCSIGALDDRIGFIIPFALITEAGCIIGLFVLGVMAVVRSITSKD